MPSWLFTPVLCGTNTFSACLTGLSVIDVTVCEKGFSKRETFQDLSISRTSDTQSWDFGYVPLTPKAGSIKKP